MLEYLHVVSNTLVPIISGFSLLIISKNEASSRVSATIISGFNLLIISKNEASSRVSAFAFFELSANATVVTYPKHLHLLH